MTPVEQYLDTYPVAKIQLGCGGNVLKGWLNTDGQMDGWFHPESVKLDATQPFPIPDNSFDFVYSEHMIEHIKFWQGQQMLAECFRIMKPGARIRISCPDFQFLLDLYLNPTELSQKYTEHESPDWAPYPNPIFIFNNYVREWGHQFIYDRPTMTNSLLATGFEDITEHKILESNVPELANLEIPSRMQPGFLQLETMTFEARKPIA
jgi:predicted SAM-dependent methyltransferase